MKEHEICKDCKDKDKNKNIDKCTTCEKRACRVCGCTWNNACKGGCYWIEFDLCSECVDVENSKEFKMNKNKKGIYVGCEASHKPVLLKYQKNNVKENALILS